jgi:hypothetical protein
MGVYATSKHVIIKAENGKYAGSGNNNDKSMRYNKFYYFDKTSPETVFTVKSQIESGNHSLYMSNGNNLYYIKEDIDKDDMRYELMEIVTGET